SEKAQKQLRVEESLNIAQTMDLTPSWVQVDQKKFRGVFKADPDRSDRPADITDALAGELYSTDGPAAGCPPRASDTRPGPCRARAAPWQQGAPNVQGGASTGAMALQEMLRI